MSISKENTPAIPAVSNRRKIIKRFLLLVSALLGFVVCWYALSRLTSSFRELRVFSGNIEKHANGSVRELRVCVFNIAHGRGLADSNWSGGNSRVRLERLKRIGQLLKSMKPDVVVLNEVDFASSWSDGVNQAEIIAGIVGLSYRAEERNIDVSIPFLQFRFGNAVLSRFPIVGAQVVSFPGFSALETFFAGKKKGLLCHLQLPGDKTVSLLAVHLEHRDESTCIASARLIEMLRVSGENPLFLAGDFNSTPSSYPNATPDSSGQTALDYLLAGKGFVTAIEKKPEEKIFTFRSDKPDRSIDWVLVPPDWKLLEHRPLDSKLSDHRPVFARIDLRLAK
jgi:endonuclease/exonuclease/phosphatase family metal-dependent hydrolase